MFEPMCCVLVVSNTNSALLYSTQEYKLVLCIPWQNALEVGGGGKDIRCSLSSIVFVFLFFLIIYPLFKDGYITYISFSCDFISYAF